MTSPSDWGLPEILAQFDPEEGEGETQYIDPQNVKDALTALWERTIDVRDWEPFEPALNAYDMGEASYVDPPNWDAVAGRYQIIGNGMDPLTARCSGWGWLRLDSPTALAGDIWWVHTLLPAGIVTPLMGAEVNNATVFLGHGEVVYSVTGPDPKVLPFSLYTADPLVSTSPGVPEYDIKARIDAEPPLTTAPLKIRYTFDYECRYNLE